MKNEESKENEKSEEMDIDSPLQPDIKLVQMKSKTETSRMKACKIRTYKRRTYKRRTCKMRITSKKSKQGFKRIPKRETRYA